MTGRTAPAAPGAPVLRCRELYSIRHQQGREQAILRGVDLQVGAGEFVTIMGPSGSGKSTLLHLLAGLDQASAGSIEMCGVDLVAADEERRAAVRRSQLGFIFQFFHLLPDLTVWENVTLPLRIAGRSLRREQDRVRAMVDALGLAPLCDRRPAEISGGEMQRVSIARALACQPALLLADEPTGNLSSKSGEEVMALLRTVQREHGASILLVTHNPRDAACGDRILFLHDGALRSGAELTGGPFDAAVVFRRLQELGI